MKKTPKNIINTQLQTCEVKLSYIDALFHQGKQTILRRECSSEVMARNTTMLESPLYFWSVAVGTCLFSHKSMSEVRH